MIHKKIKLCVVLLLALGLSNLQAQTMYVKEKSGTQTTYSLGSITKMSFSSGNIVVSKNSGSPDTYALSDLQYLNFQDITTGIAEVEKQESTIFLYPNPVVDVLNIRLSKAENKTGLIEIISIEGKVVSSLTINAQANVYQVNITALPKGIYLCKVKNGTILETTKFLKQ